MAYHAIPEVDADGEYVGSSVGTRQQLHRGSVDSPSDFQEDEYGQMHHVFEDVSMDDDSQPGDFSDEQYIGLLHEVHPELSKAVAWSHTNLSPEDAEYYNGLIESDDFDDLNAGVEFLLERYSSQVVEVDEVTEEEPSGDDEVEDTPSAIDEWFEELDSSVIESEIENIIQASYSEEEVSTMQAVSNGYDEGSIHHEILSIGQQIASGNVTAEDAVDRIVKDHGEANAAAAYLQIKQLISEWY